MKKQKLWLIIFAAFILGAAAGFFGTHIAAKKKTVEPEQAKPQEQVKPQEQIKPQEVAGESVEDLLTAEEKLQLRIRAVQRAAAAKRSEGQEAVMAEFEKGTRALMKSHPENPELYSMLWIVASNSGDEKAVAVAKEIINSSAPEEIKSPAHTLLKKMNALGKPVAIQFTALDGREVDLTKMKGKVVLVDFWATWCGTCLAMLPTVRENYEKLHPKGFEVVGISFDYTQEALDNFLADEKLPWPQYYDAEKKFGREYAINLLPEMWLIDKKGNLRYLKAHIDLEKKIEELLAE